MQRIIVLNHLNENAYTFGICLEKSSTFFQILMYLLNFEVQVINECPLPIMKLYQSGFLSHEDQQKRNKKN